MACTVRELRAWAAQLPDDVLVGTDSGGNTLCAVLENGDDAGHCLEIGGLPACEHCEAELVPLVEVDSTHLDGTPCKAEWCTECAEERESERAAAFANVGGAA